MIFSRQIIFTVAFLVSSFVLSGCSEFLKGKPAKQEVLEIKSEDVICLKDLSSQLKKMIRSESTTTEINATFKCLDQTLNQFQNRVEGKQNADSFTAEELFIIFDKFHKDAKISKEAANDLLVLKKALLGGSEVVITKTEITDLRGYLIIIKDEVQKLLPYIKMYSFKKEDGPFSRLTIDSGFAQLRSSLKVLLSASKLGKSAYEFSDLKKLLFSLNIVETDQKELLDLAEKVKLLLVGTEPLKNESEYTIAIDSFTDLMTLSSYVLHGDVQFKIESEKQLDKAVQFVEKVLDVLQQSVQFQKHSEIKISALDAIIESVLKKNILPFQVQFSTFQNFYKKLIINVFSDQKNMTTDSLDSLRLVHIKAIQKEIAIFKLNLDFISSVQFQTETDRKNISLLQAQMSTYESVRKLKSWNNFNTEDTAFILDGFKDLKDEFISTKPVTYRFKKMVLAVNQDIWDMSWEDLARGLYGKMLARELIRGWGNSAVITESGFINWYTDFKEFAIEMKTFDPRSESIKTAKETFLQANLFTFSGNGDQQVTKPEAFQYLNMLLTGGGQQLQEIREGVAKAGCNLPEQDVFKYPVNDEKCFYDDFKQNYKNYYSNLSYLVGYLSKLSDVQFKSYYDAVMAVARFDQKQIGRIETADIRTLNMTLIYIESLFSAYDQNKNWSLSAAEVRLSYPRFRNFVTDYAHKNAQAELDEWDVFINPCRAIYPLDSFIGEAFIFLGYNGRLPKKADVNDPSTVANIYECGKFQLGFNTTYQPFTFTGEIDRKTIINTFKVLKTALDSK